MIPHAPGKQQKRRAPRCRLNPRRMVAESSLATVPQPTLEWDIKSNLFVSTRGPQQGGPLAVKRHSDRDLVQAAFKVRLPSGDDGAKMW